MKCNPEKLRQNVEHNVLADLETHRIGGAGVLVSQYGKPILHAYYGAKNGQTGEPLCPGTLFRLASMSKPIAAAAVLLQVQRGKISLDDPVSKYLPAYRTLFLARQDEDGNILPGEQSKTPLTVQLLLNHSNGLLTDAIGDRQFDAIPAQCRTSIADMADYYAASTFLTFEPLTRAWYSPVAAFDIAARIVELTSGMRYGEFLKTNLFEPLGMKNTTFCPDEDQWSRMTAMHMYSEDGKSINDMGRHIYENFALTYEAAGAALAGTPEDYEHFAQMLCNNGTYNGQSILTPEMVKRMSSPTLPQGLPGLAPSENWGLGVRVTTNDPILPAGCFGWSGAYGTHFWVDPANQLTAVYMKNSRYDGGSGAVTARMFEQAVMASMEGETR